MRLICEGITVEITTADKGNLRCKDRKISKDSLFQLRIGVTNCVIKEILND